MTEVVNKFLTVVINVLIWDKHASPVGLVPVADAESYLDGGTTFYFITFHCRIIKKFLKLKVISEGK